MITLKGEQSVTINAGENYEDAGATAHDAVDGDISKSIETTGAVDANKPGAYTVTYNVSDQSGNHADAVLRTVTVVDAVVPVITLKGEQSVTINAGENYEDAGATAHDAVDGDISKSIETTGTVDANKLGTYTVTYNVSDQSGNHADAVLRTVTVVDAVVPVITLKGEQSVTINAGGNYEDAGATAHDAVDGDISKSIETTGTVDANKPGTYTVTYNVSDQSGNHADAVLRTVTVVDKVAPVITLKGEQSVTINAGENYEDAGATAHDAVDGDISKSIKTTGTVDANRLGVYTIIYSVKDNSGNAAAAVVRTVRVVDAVSPVITLKGQQIITINAGENYKDAGATAHDDVDGDITQSIEITGMIITGTPGVYTLTFNVKDKSGNAAASVVRTVRVTVVDELAPVITLKGEQSLTIRGRGCLTRTPGRRRTTTWMVTSRSRLRSPG